MVPYDWYVHFDRKLVNQIELMHVQAVAPHRVTQLFLYPNTVQAGMATATAAVRDVGVVPWFWPSVGTAATDTPTPWALPTTGRTTASLFRALDLLRVKPWGVGVPLAGRVNGKININTVQDPQVLLALLDPPATAGTSNGFITTDVYNSANLADTNALWSRVIGSTTPLPNVPYRTQTVVQRTDATVAATIHAAPVPGKTYDDDPTAAVADRPFKPFGVSEFALQNFAGGGSTGAATPFGPGLNDTLFRMDSTGQPAGLLPYAANRSHPYQRAEALRKMYNNVTTVSGTFSVYMTVGFFEVRIDPATNQPASTVEGMDTNNQPIRRYYLGKEAYKEVPGDLRQKYFAVVDRNNAAVEQDTSSTTTFLQSSAAPFFSAVEANTAALASTLTVAAPYADGTAVGLKAGDVLYVGTGSTQERVTVTAPPGAAAGGLVTVSVSPMTRAHAAGEPVTNVVLGNPGPQPKFDWRDTRYASPNSVLPYCAPVLPGE